MVVLFIHYMYPYLFQKGPEAATERNGEFFGSNSKFFYCRKGQVKLQFVLLLFMLIYLSLFLLSPSWDATSSFITDNTRNVPGPRVLSRSCEFYGPSCWWVLYVYFLGDSQVGRMQFLYIKYTLNKRRYWEDHFRYATDLLLFYLPQF